MPGLNDQIDENNQELNELQNRIDNNSAEKQSLEGEIDVLNENITELQMAINKLDVQVADVEAEIRTAEAEIAGIQEEIDVVEGAATDQAVELYKNGGVETVEALLEAKSISQLNDRLEMMGVAAEKNTDALIDYSRLKAEIQAVNRVLFAKRDELDRTLADKTKYPEPTRRHQGRARRQVGSGKRQARAGQVTRGGPSCGERRTEGERSCRPRHRRG